MSIEHAKQNGDWSTKVSSASYGIHVTSAACYDHNKSHNCNDVWYKSSNDLKIKLDINVDGVTPPPHPISDDTDPVSIGLGDISYYDSFGNSKKFDDIKSVTNGHYTVNFSYTTAACTIIGNSSSIGTYMECDKSIQARTVKDENNNNRLVFLCTNDKANENSCPWIVKKLNSAAYLGQSIYS
jgi:hypothetical protein